LIKQSDLINYLKIKNMTICKAGWQIWVLTLQRQIGEELWELSQTLVSLLAAYAS
jgi:hypothetical protein